MLSANKEEAERKKPGAMIATSKERYLGFCSFL